ncbi:MAG: helix-turn-helix domain-containing protein [Syntrophales bacterium]|nr:helix-turn-helix domain-containing protein [Syntrophales bacterium]MDD5232227.1 helix-turn-helix domain-containing protein [Syntrophales bacterium]MDD5533308.1 helix-turn-helix domain-containing protein [Syntrophales bacterium]
MDRCYECDSPLEVIKDRPYQYKESGLDYVWLIGILQYKCSKCKETFVEIPRIKELHLLIGRTIVCRKESLRGQEVKYLRKEIGMKSKEMAAALSMEPETYSRWENGKQAIAACHDKALRMIYVVNASENAGKVLSQGFPSVLPDLASRKPPLKTKKVQFSPSEWLNKLDEPLFGGEFCPA